MISYFVSSSGTDKGTCLLMKVNGDEIDEVNHLLLLECLMDWKRHFFLFHPCRA